MSELTTTDLETYTGGRLVHTDPQTGLLLDSATAAARRYCGWHVTPVIEDDSVTVDGPGGVILSLPTMNLIEVSAITENGISLDVTKLDVSQRRGIVRKYPCRWWTDRYGAISVTMTHGFTETEAADWRLAVLQFADMMSLEIQGSYPLRDEPDMTRKTIDDITYEWSAKLLSTNAQLEALFSAYRILPTP